MNILKHPNSTRRVLGVKTLGPLLERDYQNSLHVFADEHARRGVSVPAGLWYLGPVSRGLFQPVDETRVEVAFDPGLISLDEIVFFLSQLGIETELVPD